MCFYNNHLHISKFPKFGKERSVSLFNIEIGNRAKASTEVVSRKMIQNKSTNS